MRTTILQIAVLLLLFAAFVASVALTASGLPPQVATHFDLQGQPNGWMSRQAHVIGMTALGLLLPLVMVGIFVGIRWLPASLINLPHRDYWLAPERRQQTNDTLLQFALWLACGQVLFIGGLNYLVVLANQQQPARLANGPTMLTFGLFVLGMLTWIVALLWRFGRKPTGGVPG